MGWKAFAIFATGEPGYFGSFPQHDPEVAESIRLRLGLAGYERSGEQTLDVALYPDGEVMALVLHSVVNLWGYSVYSRGKLLRSAAGASDNGLITNLGEPLPEELRALRECPIDKVDEQGDGEELVFDVARRMFGKRIDEFPELPLRMNAYRRKDAAPMALIKKLFGRGG